MKKVSVRFGREEVETLRKLARDMGYPSLSSFLRDAVKHYLSRRILEY